MPVTPSGPKNFLRFGDASHFLLSFTSWWAITVGMRSPVHGGRTGTAADSRAGHADRSTGWRQSVFPKVAEAASSGLRPRFRPLGGATQAQLDWEADTRAVVTRAKLSVNSPNIPTGPQAN